VIEKPKQEVKGDLEKENVTRIAKPQLFSHHVNLMRVARHGCRQLMAMF